MNNNKIDKTGTPFGKGNNLPGRLCARNLAYAGTTRHKKTRYLYESKLLDAKAKAVFANPDDPRRFLASPVVSKKHIREWCSGWVRAGVDSVNRKLGSDEFPRFNQCWANARNYIAYNDVERPCSDYLYQEGWFLVQKTVDGDYPRPVLVHHGRAVVKTSIGNEHIIDLTYKDAIPVLVDSIPTTPGEQRALFNAGMRGRYQPEGNTTSLYVAKNRHIFTDSIDQMFISGSLTKTEYKQAVTALNEVLAHSRLPGRKMFHVRPWGELGPIARTKSESRAEKLKMMRRKAKKAIAKASKKKNRGK